MDVEELINILGRKVFGDLADTLEGAIDEGDEFLREARRYTDAMREVAPAFRNKRCKKCGEEMAANHRCAEDAEDVIDVEADKD